MGSTVGGTLIATLALFTRVAAADPAVAAFPLLPEEAPASTAAPAAATPPPVGMASLPATDPAPIAAAPAAPPPPVAPPPPAFPAPVLQPPAPLLPARVPAGTPPAKRSQGQPEHDQKQDDVSQSEAWMVAVEGFTRVPLDMGIQAGLEFPIGLRLSAGYGWVPTPYRDFLTRSLTKSAGAGNNTAAVIRQGTQEGRTLRLQAGIRPFRKLGFYLDAGFANIELGGSIDGDSLRGVTPGTYEATTSIDTWLLELGYQGWAGRHLTFAAALGLNGIMSSTSELKGPGLDPALAESIAQTADKHVEDYGVIPTLTLRLGFDVI